AVAQALAHVTVALESPIRRAIIPAAGGQHRVLATHVMQNLLLAVIGEAAAVGIDRVVLILPPGTTDSLYGPLEEALGLAIIPAITLEAREQPAPDGLGDAVLQAETFVNREPFALLLPDDVVDERTGR